MLETITIGYILDAYLSQLIIWGVYSFFFLIFAGMVDQEGFYASQYKLFDSKPILEELSFLRPFWAYFLVFGLGFPYIVLRTWLWLNWKILTSIFDLLVSDKVVKVLEKIFLKDEK